MEIEKEKGKNPPRLGRFWPNLLPSPQRASLPVRPTRPVTRAPARAGATPPPPLTGWPHPEREMCLWAISKYFGD
jgi:hypothetical protein